MNMTAAGLGFASIASILGFSLGGRFAHGFTDPKLVAVVLGVVVAATWHDWSDWREMEFARPVIIYVGCLLPSLLSSIDLPTSLFGFVNEKSNIYSGGLLTTLLCAGGLLMAEQVATREAATNVRRAIFAAGALAAVAAIGQRMGHDVFNFGLNEGRAMAFSGAHHDAGSLFVVLLSFLTVPVVRPLYGAAIWATDARAAALGGLVALVPVRHRVKAFAVLAFAGMAYACLPATNQSDRGRQGLWKIAAESASFLGAGPATFPQVMATKWTPEVHAQYQPEVVYGKFFQGHAHNAILDTMVTKGFFGLLGLLTLLAVPELAGLWTVAMFNPISFEIVFVACVLAGLNRRLQGENL